MRLLKTALLSTTLMMFNTVSAATTEMADPTAAVPSTNAAVARLKAANTEFQKTVIDSLLDAIKAQTSSRSLGETAQQSITKLLEGTRDSQTKVSDVMAVLAGTFKAFKKSAKDEKLASKAEIGEITRKKEEIQLLITAKKESLNAAQLKQKRLEGDQTALTEELKDLYLEHEALNTTNLAALADLDTERSAIQTSLDDIKGQSATLAMMEAELIQKLDTLTRAKNELNDDLDKHTRELQAETERVRNTRLLFESSDDEGEDGAAGGDGNPFDSDVDN